MSKVKELTTTHAIFENWTDYDKLKKKGKDVNYFSFTEEWETRYLQEKIKRYFPSLPTKDIAAAIDHCCTTASPPYPRELFVAYVLSRFRIRVR